MDFDPIAYIETPRWNQVDLGLDRIDEMLEELGRPQDSLRFVHVAGTNGKGSVCSYIASTLKEAGYKTGLFTSPYIECFEERIRVDGENIPLDALTEITLRVRDVAEAMEDHPTEFELMCAVGMVYFAQCACDLVVLEVGLGGRWDATNVIDAPELCVICRLGLDHTGLLGSTLAEIAGEKAGIIKEACRVVSWPQESEAMEVLETICGEKGARISYCDFDELEIAPLRIDLASDEMPTRRFRYRKSTFETQLLGSYQPSNAALAIDALYALREQGWAIPDEAIFAGIAKTRWPGRFEVCATRPLFIVDGGHNPQGAQVMAETLRELLPETKTVFLIGILADKDYRAMIRKVVPLASAFVCVTPPTPRALANAELAKEIAAIADELGEEPTIATSDFDGAPALARRFARESGAVCAFGSLYSIASVKTALRKALGK